MTEKKPQGTRREFLKRTGTAAAATTILTAASPRVHAAEDNSIRVVIDRLRWARHWCRPQCIERREWSATGRTC